MRVQVSAAGFCVSSYIPVSNTNLIYSLQMSLGITLVGANQNWSSGGRDI